MEPSASLLIENFAPWLTAIGAFIFGVMSHRRSGRVDEATRAQSAIQELHNVYHNLVNDLGVQVERLTEQNEGLAAANEVLTRSLEVVQAKNAELKTTLEKLNRQVKALTKKLDAINK